MTTLVVSSDRANHLVDLIETEIAKNPFPFDGHHWMDWPKSAVADHLHINVRTLTRLAVPKNGIVARAPKIEGRKRYLLRVGQDTKTPRDLSNILSAMWRKRVGRSTAPKEFGCICGLVQQWGDQAPQIFRSALDHWPVYAACFKLEFTEEYLSQSEDRDKAGYPTRHYRYPSLTVLRRFAHMAPEIYQGLKQGWLDKDAKAA